MPNPRRRPTVEGVDPHDVHLCGLHLDCALDALIDARRSLSPQPKTWSPPSSALYTATDTDAEHRRHAARVKEVADRLRGLAPALGFHVDELRSAASDMATRAAEVGFGVGVSVALQGRRKAPLDHGDESDGLPNRES